MQPKDFLYFLTNKDGASYYQDNGVVATSTTPKPLDISPDGWQDTSIKWERNEKYFGLFRSFTTPLKFVAAAAKTLRTRFYQFGTEDKINLLILWLDKTFGGGWVHRTFYRGELDLSQSTDELTHFQTNIMEGDLVKLFKANENTKYEIPITGPLVQDDGIFLYQTINYLFTKQPQPGTVSNPARVLDVFYLTTEGTAFGVEPSSSYALGLLISDTSPASTYWIFRTIQDIPDMHIRGKMKFKVGTVTAAGAYRLFLKTSTNREILIYTNPTALANQQVVEFDYDIPFSAFEGELFFLVNIWPVNSLFFIIYEENEFQLYYKSRYKTTYTRTMRPVEAGQALLDKIAGPGYTFKSDYLSNVWENLVITSGDAIRGIENAVIKTSISDLFTSYNVPCNLSMNIKGPVLSFEPKAAAFDATVVQQLGEVGELKVVTNKEAQFNVVKAGYPALDNHSFDSLNAKGEFNVTSTLTSSVSRINKVLELISIFKASMYEQEVNRINLEGKKTTADSSDNDVYFKLIEKQATITGGGGGAAEPPLYYKLLRENYTSITGLLDPASAYNIPLSPMRCILAHGNYLRSIFYWQEGTQLVFQTSDTSAALKTVKDGVTIEERANVSIGLLADPLFIPLDFNITCPMAREIVKTMTNSPAGTFSFERFGEPFYGFAKTIGIQPANRPVQESVLLCSPQSDLSKLIH